MYPRLALLRQFLRNDGAIFISIDDNEISNLRQLTGEIFGEQNFVAHLIWQKKYSPQNDALFFSEMHDHILVFARNAEHWTRNLIPRTEKQDKAYKNPDNDPRGVWKARACFQNDLSQSKTAATRIKLRKVRASFS